MALDVTAVAYNHFAVWSEGLLKRARNWSICFVNFGPILRTSFSSRLANSFGEFGDLRPERPHVTLIMNLLNLASDIQEEILFLPRVVKGRVGVTERELRAVCGVADWEGQREFGATCWLARATPADYTAAINWPRFKRIPISVSLHSAVNLAQRLSHIQTEWTKLLALHEKDATEATRWGDLMERYLGAAYRYLLGATGDEDVAGELFQEFALRFLRGDFGKTSRERGRFRDYVRKVLINLVNDYRRERQKAVHNLSPEAERHVEVVETGDDASFVDRWREEILFQTWETLRNTQPNYYEVLRLQTEVPDLPSREMAEQLSSRLHRTMTAANVRKTLQRARERFATLLLYEVLGGLDNPTADELRTELQQLSLLSYCRSALEARVVEDNEA